MNKISVIVPCYNSENTISRCLSSILNQTYKNFELIVVDDGSSDNTLQTIQKFCDKDKRIKLLHKTNGGVGSARNYALKYADGDYIQFVDSDDDIAPKMFEKMIQVAQQTNADIVTCRFNHCCFMAFLPSGEYYMQKKSDFQKLYLDFFTFNVPWNKLFKRQVITQPFNETLKIFEDGLFVLANLKNANKVVVLEGEYYNYFNASIKDKNSLVNIFLRSEFWKTQTGYWYKFDKIKPLFDALLKDSGYNEKILLYARSFDMAFWELIKLIDSGCNREICTMEMCGIFRQPNFIESVKARGQKHNLIKESDISQFIAKCFFDYKTKLEPNAGYLYNKFVDNFYIICLSQQEKSKQNDLVFNEIFDEALMEH